MFRRLPLLLLALALVSCASPAALVRRSDKALDQGDARKAYELARRAVQREPGNEEARRALDAAATWIADDWRARIVRLADVDTIAAARQTLEFQTFRAQAADDGARLAADREFERTETALRVAARGIHTRAGKAAAKSQRWKRAHVEYEQALRYAGASSELSKLVDQAYQRAQTRVVLMPMRDEAGLGPVSRELTDDVYAALARGMASDDFRYTRLVPVSEVWEHVTVAQLDDLRREDALKLARKLGASQVVFGRAFGLHSDTNTGWYRERVYRRYTEKDSTGTHERWSEEPMDVIWRRRDVTVQADFEVIDVDDETVLGHRVHPFSRSARTAWTSFHPVGECKEYGLYTPAMKSQSSTRVARLESEWKEAMGETALPGFLEQARSHRTTRSGWKREYRRDWVASAAQAVWFLNDLPPVTDLAYAALLPSAGTLREELARLDPLDPVDALDPSAGR